MISGLSAISRYKNSKVPKEVHQEHYIHPPEYKLYDLDTDPHELNNQAD